MKIIIVVKSGGKGIKIKFDIQYSLSKTLFAMRCRTGKTQNQIAVAMKCSQGKVSKIENSIDTDISIDDLAEYCFALDMRLEIGFSDLRMTMVDRVKWHYFKLKRLIDEMLNNGQGG